MGANSGGTTRTGSLRHDGGLWGGVSWQDWEDDPFPALIYSLVARIFGAGGRAQNASSIFAAPADAYDQIAEAYGTDTNEGFSHTAACSRL